MCYNISGYMLWSVIWIRIGKNSSYELVWNQYRAITFSESNKNLAIKIPWLLIKFKVPSGINLQQFLILDLFSKLSWQRGTPWKKLFSVCIHSQYNTIKNLSEITFDGNIIFVYFSTSLSTLSLSFSNLVLC